MALVKGQQYTKRDFGILPPKARNATHTVNGEIYSFFNMVHPERSNRIDTDGFVYQSPATRIISPGIKQHTCAHVFVKTTDGPYYTYLGKSSYEEHYDDTHNKAFW